MWVLGRKLCDQPYPALPRYYAEIRSDIWDAETATICTLPTKSPAAALADGHRIMETRNA